MNHSKLLFFLIPFCSAISSYSQKLTRLPDSYLLNKRELETGKPLSINKYVNYDLLLKLQSDSVKNLQGEGKTDYYSSAFKEEPVSLNNGNYYIDNASFNFQFRINDKGLLSDSAKLVNKLKDVETSFFFIDGVAVKTVSEHSGRLYNKSLLTDSIFADETYNKEGNVQVRHKINLKSGGGQANTITTHYFSNGRIGSEQNNSDETFFSYYENGKPKRQTDGKNKWGKNFDHTGRLEDQYYRKGDEDCKEKYDNGFLSAKTCSSQTFVKYYFYKNGKLEHYEVYSISTKQTKVFDAKGKPLNSEPVSNKIPSVSF